MNISTSSKSSANWVRYVLIIVALLVFMPLLSMVMIATHPYDDALKLMLLSDNGVIVRLYLAFGGDPEKSIFDSPRSSNKTSLLWYSIDYRRDEAARVLVANGANCRKEGKLSDAVFISAHHGLVKTVSECFRQGVHLKFSDDEKTAMLFQIAAGASPELIRWGVAQGWDIKGKIKDGRGILHYVIGNASLIKPDNINALIELGADVNSRANGLLPLDYLNNTHWVENEAAAISLIRAGSPLDYTRPERRSLAEDAGYYGLELLATEVMRQAKKRQTLNSVCSDIDRGLGKADVTSRSSSNLRHNHKTGAYTYVLDNLEAVAKIALQNGCSSLPNASPRLSELRCSFSISSLRKCS